MTIVVEVDGRVSYRMFRVDEARLSLDLVNVVSSIRFRKLPVDHAILKGIRIGQHPQKLRLVFDLNQAGRQGVRYDVKEMRNKLVIQLFT